MNTTLRRDADEIICSSIQAVLPDKAVCRALEDFQPGGGRQGRLADGIRRRAGTRARGRRRGGDQVRPCEGRNPRHKLL